MATLQGGHESAAVAKHRGVNLTYYELYRMKADQPILRQKMASCARQKGIKETVRQFGCSRNTVRKWLRRYQPGKPSPWPKCPGVRATVPIRPFRPSKGSWSACESKPVLARNV